MESEDRNTWILIGLALVAGLVPATTGLLVWFIKNVMTPAGTLERMALVLDSPNPWDWVIGLLAIVVMMIAGRAAIAWIRDELGI